jgi:hypothetical protein
MKTIKFIELPAIPFFAKTYAIYVDNEEWYRSTEPPDWFFWVGMMQQYGGQIVNVEHKVIQ